MNRPPPLRFPLPWLIALALLLAGCERAPKLAPLGPEAVILAFGDSLTHGTGASEGQSYPAELERLTGYRVINAGIPGEVSASGAQRLPGLLDRERPELLILCHGGNDLLRRNGDEQTRQNLERMIETARSRGVSVVLVAVPRPGLWLEPAEFYAELAERYDLPLVKEAIPDILAERSLKSDQIHPNAAGYRRLAEEIYKALERSGAV